MFTDLIVQPLFNLLVAVYALLPGHNFGLALIIFTIIIRLLLWPLVRKQLHQSKAMRDLQPELKRIKQAAKGDRQKEYRLQMELYKERGIKPFSAFPVLIVQFIILIALYSGLLRIIKDPHSLIDFAYPFLQNLDWMLRLADNIKLLDYTLFGWVDLSKAALSSSGIYWPALLIVTGSAVAQYYQAKQLMPDTKDQRSLRAILREASAGKQADQSEVNAAVSRSMRYLIPVLIFVFTIGIASALSLYWFISGLVAYVQQSIILNQDEKEMDELASQPSKRVADIPEAEIVAKPKSKKAVKKTKSKKAAKRRKK